MDRGPRVLSRKKEGRGSIEDERQKEILRKVWKQKGKKKATKSVVNVTPRCDIEREMFKGWTSQEAMSAQQQARRGGWLGQRKTIR